MSGVHHHAGRAQSAAPANPWAQIVYLVVGLYASHLVLTWFVRVQERAPARYTGILVFTVVGVGLLVAGHEFPGTTHWVLLVLGSVLLAACVIVAVVSLFREMAQDPPVDPSGRRSGARSKSKNSKTPRSPSA